MGSHPLLTGGIVSLARPVCKTDQMFGLILEQVPSYGELSRIAIQP